MSITTKILNFFSTGQRTEIETELRRFRIMTGPYIERDQIVENSYNTINDRSFYIGSGVDIQKTDNFAIICAKEIREKAFIVGKTIKVRDRNYCIFINKDIPNTIMFADDCQSKENILMHLVDVPFKCLSITIDDNRSMYINTLATKKSNMLQCKFDNLDEIMIIVEKMARLLSCKEIGLLDAAHIETLSSNVGIGVIRLLKNMEKISIYEKYGFKCINQFAANSINVIKSIRLDDLIKEVVEANNVINFINHEIKDAKLVEYNSESDIESETPQTNYFDKWKDDSRDFILTLYDKFSEVKSETFKELPDPKIVDIADFLINKSLLPQYILKINNNSLLLKTIKFCAALKKFNIYYRQFRADAKEIYETMSNLKFS